MEKYLVVEYDELSDAEVCGNDEEGAFVYDTFEDANEAEVEAEHKVIVKIDVGDGDSDDGDDGDEV